MNSSAADSSAEEPHGEQPPREQATPAASTPDEQQRARRAAELAALRLHLVPGIGPRMRGLLLGRFGSAEAIFQAEHSRLMALPGIGSQLASAVTDTRYAELARIELHRCAEMGVSLLLAGDAGFPRLLSEIPDPPAVLYRRGTGEPADALAVAVVGSRQCSAYGQRMARRLAHGLAAAGMTVVSGLARGIDTRAHEGALEAGGRTIAVCATGLASIYPPENANLADRICDSGAMVTESPLGQKPVRGLFPQRNRIISGLSQGVVIIEASRRSGALHTARHAMEQGRQVFAVPGQIDSLRSEGCHDLIRDGVTLIRSVDDILEDLGPLVEPGEDRTGRTVHAPRELTLTEQERTVLEHVPQEPCPIDQVVRSTGLETSRVLTTLTVLEMKRLVRRMPGGQVVRSG